ncbi:MAG TPA: hypothetical protein VFK36_01625 [Gemmatimonadales bacterium]|nr:hypothetical protein [Gemmatimonadales bacterium]
MRRSLAVTLLLAVACRGEQPGSTPESARLAHVMDSLRPAVEQAVGLTFKSPPRSAIRSRDEVRRYLVNKLDEELTPERERGVEAAYRLLGMIPDSVSLRALLLDLLTEQVVGYYDADSAMFFGVTGAPPEQLGVTVAHEMVHALQGQYVDLDSLLKARGDNDRATAAQAILEGQALLASIQVMAPSHDVLNDDAIWSMLKAQTRQAQNTMPKFGAAPLVVREGLIFPYVEGALFMRWWETQSGHADTVPFGALMPQSSEEILHPERYTRGDAPLRVAIDSVRGERILHEDGLGELEATLLGATLAREQEPKYEPPLGWGGDRYRVIDTAEGPALIWYLVFDDAASAARFDAGTGALLRKQQRKGYRGEFTMTQVSGHPAARYVMAPVGWTGWKAIPGAEAE